MHQHSERQCQIMGCSQITHTLSAHRPVCGAVTHVHVHQSMMWSRAFCCCMWRAAPALLFHRELLFADSHRIMHGPGPTWLVTQVNARQGTAQKWKRFGNNCTLAFCATWSLCWRFIAPLSDAQFERTKAVTFGFNLPQGSQIFGYLGLWRVIR